MGNFRRCSDGLNWVVWCGDTAQGKKPGRKAQAFHFVSVKRVRVISKRYSSFLLLSVRLVCAALCSWSASSRTDPDRAGSAAGEQDANRLAEPAARSELLRQEISLGVDEETTVGKPFDCAVLQPLLRNVVQEPALALPRHRVSGASDFE